MCVCVCVCVGVFLSRSRFIYNFSFQFDLGFNVVSDLIPFVDDSSDRITDMKCGKKSIFMKQIYERSKSALTKDIQ